MLVRAIASLLVFVAVGAAAACSSVPDVTFSDDAGGSSGSDGSDGSSGGFDGGDGAPEAAPGCVKTGPEVCDDGLDNDCNGQTDCMDPACNAGYTCSDPPPSGWALVAFSEATQPACPTGFGASTDLKVVEGTGSGGTCSCACVGGGGAVEKCADGKYTLGYGAGVCNTSTAPNLNAAQGACSAFAAPLDVPSGTFAAVNAISGPTFCSGNSTKNAAPLTDGRKCAVPRVGKGCSGAQVCIPKPTGMKACISKPGADSCPTSFTAQRRAGTGATDNRVCSGDCSAACSAAPAPCTGSVTIYANATCNTSGQKFAPVTAGASCATLADDFGTNGVARAYTSMVTGGCGTPQGFSAALTGAVTFAGPETVCCKP